MKGMYVMKRTFCVIAVLLLALSLCGCAQKAPEGPTWQEQYDLGVKYLSEGNYEEAIIAFTAAIEIDPTRPEAYIGLADVHTARGDTMAAMDVLNQALGAVGENDALSAALEKLRGEPRTRRVDWEDGSYLIIEYDDNGNKVCQTQYDADGTLEAVTEYDADGKEVRQTLYFDDGAVEVWLYEYDADGKERTVRTISYESDGTEWNNLLREYDADGKEVRRTWYNTDGTVSVYEETEYDAEGKVVRDNMYDADGTMAWYTVYEYDAEGKKVRETWYHTDGTVSRVEEYDADGNLVRRTQYNDDGTVWSVDEYN